MSAAVAFGGARRRQRAGEAPNSFVVVVASVMGGMAGWVAAQGGPKGMLAITGAAVLTTILLFAKDRERLAMVTATLSVAAILHKSFSTILPVSGGPVSVYITTVDVLLGVLYLFWFASGELFSDLGRELKRPVLWLPIIGSLFVLPSLVVAGNSTLALAELTRMLFAYLLFLYVACRVRTRRDIGLMVTALAALGILEMVVALGQWATHGNLGLSFLGTPATLNQRITDTSVLGRPFGTITHPVFMAAFLGPIALMGLSMAIHERARARKWLWLAASGAAVVPMIVSHTRAGALAIAIATAMTCVVLVCTRRIPVTTAAWFLCAAIVLAVALWPQISALYHDDFHTEHFGLEVNARGQLNDVAYSIIHTHPEVGIGLNNFEQVMDSYDRHGLIFDGNPVHNLFLLQISETGYIGFVGFLMAVLPVFFVALRLSRAKERKLAAVGVGVAAMFIFFTVEELFVFSLRQDHPRTIFWLFCGLAVAAARIAENEGALAVRRPRRTTPTARHAPTRSDRGRVVTPVPATPVTATSARRRRWKLRPAFHVRSTVFGRRHRPPRKRLRAAVAGLSVLVLCGAGFGDTAVPADAPALSSARLVFVARDRATGHESIYVANGDASNPQLIAGGDGVDYEWAEWAMNGNKIVFTTRSGPVGTPEHISMMDPDGTNRVTLTTNAWRAGQPRVSPDGRKLIFTASWPEFRQYAIYQMDLATLQIVNLSAASSTSGAADADPKWAPDGNHIVYASSTNDAHEVIPTQILLMNPDGTGRTAVTHDTFFNTDPEMSPDGTEIAIASYRGEGEAHDDTSPSDIDVKLHDWFLTVRTVGSDEERVLNAGKDCASRPAAHPCDPLEAPAYIPNWTPDGNAIGYLGILSRTTVCICVVNRDGKNPRALLTTAENEIQWFDWVVPGPPPTTAVLEPGKDAPSSQLLLTSIAQNGQVTIATARPDRWGDKPVSFLGQELIDPLFARWTPDRQHIVFTASLAYDPKAANPGPAPPSGDHRHRHYTLSSLGDYLHPPVDRADADRRQVFELDVATKHVRQLTKPWIEDWRDAIPDGEWRGNVEPDVSQDGSFMVVTNVSTSNHESFILRVDMATGDVLNLTNATAGAMPTSDFQPRISPDGSTVAFATADGEGSQIALVDASTGNGYRKLTDDAYLNMAPAWSPDGRYLVYSSYRGTDPVILDPDTAAADAASQRINRHDWYLVRIDTATGEQRVLTQPQNSPTFAPAWSPDGASIAFISVTGPPDQPDVWIIPAEGGVARPVQITLETKEISVDWR